MYVYIYIYNVYIYIYMYYVYIYIYICFEAWEFLTKEPMPCRHPPSLTMSSSEEGHGETGVPPRAAQTGDSNQGCRGAYRMARLLTPS